MSSVFFSIVLAIIIIFIIFGLLVKLLQFTVKIAIILIVLSIGVWLLLSFFPVYPFEFESSSVLYVIMQDDAVVDAYVRMNETITSVNSTYETFEHSVDSILIVSKEVSCERECLETLNKTQMAEYIRQGTVVVKKASWINWLSQQFS